MKTEEGLVLLQTNPDFAADLNVNSKFYGWLFFKHPDGQWVTKRKLETWEITQADDQDYYNIVKKGGVDNGL